MHYHKKITSKGGCKWKCRNPASDNRLLASCPWGPVTANGVDLLTEIYVIYMEAHTSHRAIAGERVTDAVTPGKLGNIYRLAKIILNQTF